MIGLGRILRAGWVMKIDMGCDVRSSFGAIRYRYCALRKLVKIELRGRSQMGKILGDSMIWNRLISFAVAA